MKKPAKRTRIPPRKSDNVKRRLHPNPDPKVLDALQERVTYRGIAKHKKDPRAFDLSVYRFERGDETLCDAHAGFRPEDMPDIPALMCRGIAAGLVGNVEKQGVPTIIWAVSDGGWIFEARISNPATAEYHGYPVRPSEAIAEKVYERFARWVDRWGIEGDLDAVKNCRDRYGFR